ncbi:MAG: HAD family phosphatase [Verrucomicrobiota bacterium]
MSDSFIFGAIFDWDGVLIDSSSHHEESWRALVLENGRKFSPDFFKKSFGMKNNRIIPEVLGWTQDPVEIKKISDRKIVKKRPLQALPGAVQWVTELKAKEIPRVIASSTDRKNIELGLQIIGLDGFFTEIVSAEDVNQGKPNPDVFLKAAEKIKMLPRECIVFEDAHVGIEAARRAHIKVVALMTTHSKESLHEADYIIENLEEMNFEIAQKTLNPSST